MSAEAQAIWTKFQDDFKNFGIKHQRKMDRIDWWTQLKELGFGPDDFARSHPGGALGRRLLTRVSDVMHTGDAIPVVPAEATVMDALREISVKRMGMTAVRNGDGTLAFLVCRYLARPPGRANGAAALTGS